MDRLFGLPYCEMDIDVDKIFIEYETEKRWASFTPTSYFKENIVPQDSLIYILEKIKDFTNNFVSSPHTLKLINIWANEYSHKDFQESHIHGQSDLSFVIFKEIEKEKNRLSFFSPAYELIQTRDFWEDEAVSIERNIDCGATQGQMVIFPSFIRHMVYPNQSDEKRITYSGNVEIEIIK